MDKHGIIWIKWPFSINNVICDFTLNMNTWRSWKKIHVHLHKSVCITYIVPCMTHLDWEDQVTVISVKEHYFCSLVWQPQPYSPHNTSLSLQKVSWIQYTTQPNLRRCELDQILFIIKFFFRKWIKWILFINLRDFNS